MNTYYSYQIKIVSITEIKELEKILNDYAKQGFRTVSFEKLNNVLYQGNKTKYTVVLESKVRTKPKNNNDRYKNE